MSRGRKTYWTEYRLRQAALSCRTQKEFRERFWSAYLISKRQGLFEEITRHMRYERVFKEETSSVRKRYAKLKKGDKDWFKTYMILYKRGALPPKKKRGGKGWSIKPKR